jgi:ADP-ribose pyrophosphatase
VEEKFNKRLREAKGRFLHFCVDEVTLSNGHISTREMVLHPGAVAVIAVTAEKEVILVKQYRYPVKEVLYEIPAGKLEPGEDPAVCAPRELAEETGFLAEKWEKLGTFYTAPGFSNETMHLFYATGLRAEEAHPDPDEIITYEKISLRKAWEMIRTGQIKDGKTILAILWIEQMITD